MPPTENVGRRGRTEGSVTQGRCTLVSRALATPVTPGPHLGDISVQHHDTQLLAG